MHPRHLHLRPCPHQPLLSLRDADLLRGFLLLQQPVVLHLCRRGAVGLRPDLRQRRTRRRWWWWWVELPSRRVQHGQQPRQLVQRLRGPPLRRRLLLLHYQVGLDLRLRAAVLLRPDLQVICWRSAAVAALIAAAASLSSEQISSVKAAYRRLSARQIEARPMSGLPEGARIERIDVSERLRSASFGHEPALVVRLGDQVQPVEFWVEYGRSTNHPSRLFGPSPSLLESSAATCFRRAH